MRQNVPSLHVKMHNEDSLPSVSFPANDLDCTLRNGDYVVKFSHLIWLVLIYMFSFSFFESKAMFSVIQLIHVDYAHIYLLVLVKLC